MPRDLLSLIAIICLVVTGCSGDAPAPPNAVRVKPPQDDIPNEPPPQSEPPDEEEVAQESGPAGSRELELKESRLAFMVPAGWKDVEPETRIVEAEFELPRAAGDEFDGRLTLMSSLGEREEVIGRRTSEFRPEPGESPSRETLSVAEIESTIVDLRGEWKGPDFRPVNPPRANYRMLFVVVPFTQNGSFYAKLVGPRATIAAHEEAFREFLKSARKIR